CARRRMPESELANRIADMPPAMDYKAALLAAERPALIAEVKKASPSKGVIREDFEPVEIAEIFVRNGATCLSVLTDEPYFQGRMSYLRSIREEVEAPILRKDFIIEQYQVIESRAAGADAILLIAAALKLEQLDDLVGVSHQLGMAALVEVHDAQE